MPTASSLDSTIQDLGRSLTPVRPLPPPLLRAAAWIGLAALLGTGLAGLAGVEPILHRLAAAPDMALAALGCGLTAVAGAVAVFELSLPDRRATWVLLPLPPLLLWIGASGLGCLRAWIVPGTHHATMAETGDCLVFIVGMSLPLSAAMTVMVRRAFPLRPGLTAGLAGLTCAAGAATLLNFFHPYDASATDLLVHLAAVLIVVGAHRLLSGAVRS